MIDRKHDSANLVRFIWDKVFKSGPSKTCGRQPLKKFTWSILEYFVPYKGSEQMVVYFYSIQSTKVLLLKSFYFSLKWNTCTAKFNQVKQINSRAHEMSLQSLQKLQLLTLSWRRPLSYRSQSRLVSIW